MPTTYTIDEFAKIYAEGSGMSIPQMVLFDMVPCPCKCKEKWCKGWQMTTVASLRLKYQSGEIDGVEFTAVMDWRLAQLS
jgi:hypothetical protein